MLSYIRDRFLTQRIQRDEKEIKIGFIVTATFLAFLLANIIYLNVLILYNNATAPKNAATIYKPPSSSKPSLSETPSSNQTATVTAPSPSTSTNSVKDYYINLGSGSSQSSDWVDVPGTLSTFDIASYPNIKEVHLETNVNVPTANGSISVRLFNKTGNYGVWNSERTVQAQAVGDLIISQNIIYDRGPRLYSIQTKSQLGVLANVVQARIHIITY